MACYINPNYVQYRRDDNHANKSDEQLVDLIATEDNMLEFCQLYFELTVRKYDFSKNIDLVYLYYEKYNDIVEAERNTIKHERNFWYPSYTIIAYLIQFARPISFLDIIKTLYFLPTICQIAIKHGQQINANDFITILESKNDKGELFDWTCCIDKYMTLMVQQGILNRETPDNSKLMDYIFTKLCWRFKSRDIIFMITPAYMPTYEDHWLYISYAYKTEQDLKGDTHRLMCTLHHGIDITDQQRLNLVCLYGYVHEIKRMLQAGVNVSMEVFDIMLNSALSKMNYIKTIEILTLLVNYKFINRVSNDICRKLYKKIADENIDINSRDDYNKLYDKVNVYNLIKINNADNYGYASCYTPYTILWMHASKVIKMYECIKFMKKENIGFEIDEDMLTLLLKSAKKEHIQHVKNVISIVPYVTEYLNEEYIEMLKKEKVCKSVINCVQKFM